MIQIYGRFDSWWSHSQVSRGIVAGLYRNRLEDLQIMSLNRYGGYEGLSEPIERGGYNVRIASGQLADAPVGLYVGGYPPQLGEWLDSHAFKAALFICESAALPPHWGMIADQLDLIVVPSDWTRKAYAEAGVDPSKLIVVPHGVHPLYGFARAIQNCGKPKFLHIAGARDFIDRKGTPQLIEAFKNTFAPGDAELTIRTPISPLMEDLCAGVKNIKLEASDQPMPVWRMRDYLCQGWTALVQPSRAEAFGIIPVEARCVGLPVICTWCTGHAEHQHPSDTLVHAGPLRAIKVQGIPNGAAPEVTAADVADAFERFFKDKEAPKGAPYGYARQWLWPAVCQQLAYRLRTAEQQHKSRKTRLEDKILGG
jgi:glycosyltransferase involved in cell wall biosynthesis